MQLQKRYHFGLSKEELVDQLKTLTKKLERVPTAREFDEDEETVSFQTIRRRFYSWRNFLGAAGFELVRHRNISKEEALVQVQTLAKRMGRTPTAQEFNNNSMTITCPTVRKLFGSWNNFLKAAGLDIIKYRIISKEEALVQVQTLAKRMGRTPTAQEFNNDPKTASYQIAIKLFGSWSNFLGEAGLESRKKSVSEEELINQVQMLKREFGRTPTGQEFDKDPRTASYYFAVKFFGSWNNFLEEAGLDIIKLKHRNISKEEALVQVQTLAKRMGRTPTGQEFNEGPGAISSSTIRKLFGSWSNFLGEAGLESRKKSVSEEELINQVQMLAKEFGRTPTGQEFDYDPRTASYSTIRKLFGSWNDLLKAAGFNIMIHRKLSKDAAIAQVQMLKRESERTPTEQEFDKDPRTANCSTIRKLFGSWSNFLGEAGLESRKKSVSEEELINQVQMLAKEFGRTPTVQEFDYDPRTASYYNVKKLFGSWNNLLKVARLKINR